MTKKEHVVWFAETSDTPLGPVWAAASEYGLVVIEIGGKRTDFEARLQRAGYQTAVYDPDLLVDATRQLRDYLNGSLKLFTLNVDWSRMGEFQRRALQATLAIPYGQTITYGGLATRLGVPHAARAVGRAEATNPVPLVIPCHRVVGADGKLHGYSAAGGVKTKAWLLRLEQGMLV